ncbi:MAG: C45 family autoproteolytic acyltransferase/hydrolase [Verrucomicrobiota bacterium]|jgi:isopenicillin-N N-acyltransferase-like protein|nr:C45 family autoproteolytic acyltransferase/hydrolase [Verrucomicrobiota bacterium]MDD8051857.1 C45 family autoproteolytic acyltransferase/hydrolase [Verrucomicrobiota bacterium]
MRRESWWAGLLGVCWMGAVLVCTCGIHVGLAADPAATLEKPEALAAGGFASATDPRIRTTPFDSTGGRGHRFSLAQGARAIPVVVVGGTPYEMGYQYGRLMREEIEAFVPLVLERFKQAMDVSSEELDAVWRITSAYTDDRVEQELLGLAAGAGVPVTLLQQVHVVPLLAPYSCSSVAAWGDATADGHLYQTRDLDWQLEIGAHDFPVVVVYVPDRGVAHVNPAFAGFCGAHTGMNEAGIVLSEMGDSPAREMPYNLHAPHFTTFFRSFLYDMRDLDALLTAFHALPATKRYHYVFGAGTPPARAVKLRTDAAAAEGERVIVWRDNDSEDEFAPRVLECVVYNDEGRGAFPGLQARHGQLDAEALMATARQIATRGSNVMNVVYDATAFRLWVAYAHGPREAYELPFAPLELTPLVQRFRAAGGS